MKLLSLDLRQRIINVHTNERMSQRQLAKRFQVSLSSVQRLLMDNFKSHLVKEVREAIEAVEARLVYLPPYSPDFSPIENGWSKIKECLRT